MVVVVVAVAENPEDAKVGDGVEVVAVYPGLKASNLPEDRSEATLVVRKVAVEAAVSE